MCITFAVSFGVTFAVSFGVTFAVSFGVTIFGSFLQNGYNSVTRPPIEILRPLFTLQLLILPTRDPFHAQKSLINAEIGRCHKLWLQMWLQMRLQMWLQMRLQMWCTWTHLWWPNLATDQLGTTEIQNYGFWPSLTLLRASQLLKWPFLCFN